VQLVVFVIILIGPAFRSLKDNHNVWWRHRCTTSVPHFKWFTIKIIADVECWMPNSKTLAVEGLMGLKSG